MEGVVSEVRRIQEVLAEKQKERHETNLRELQARLHEWKRKP